MRDITHQLLIFRAWWRGRVLNVRLLFGLGKKQDLTLCISSRLSETKPNESQIYLFAQKPRVCIIYCRRLACWRAGGSPNKYLNRCLRLLLQITRIRFVLLNIRNLIQGFVALATAAKEGLPLVPLWTLSAHPSITLNPSMHNWCERKRRR